MTLPPPYSLTYIADADLRIFIVEVFSAGTEPGILNSYAVRAMAEIGIDISGHRAKDLAEFDGQEMDCLVAVCEGGTCT
jgi:arsenate reductase (thioredoxin)